MFKLGRNKTGVMDTPRNRIIFDLHRKGLSMNRIAKELMRKGFDVTPQRVSDILKNPPSKTNHRAMKLH